jgi:hypothetical protein
MLDAALRATAELSVSPPRVLQPALGTGNHGSFGRNENKEAGGRLAPFRRQGRGPVPTSVWLEGLAEVVDQVVAVLDAHGQPDQVRRDL